MSNNKKHYYLAGQIWDETNGDQLKFVSLTPEEAEGRDDIVPHPFYLLPEGHKKRMSDEVTAKPVVKKSRKRPSTNKED